MTEHHATTDTNGRHAAGDRRAAHERLSTGALAGWYRACATHPGRVALSWGGIIVALIVLVFAVGGGLKDEFEIPGSDTQKATDLIESEFTSEQEAISAAVSSYRETERLREALAEGIADVEAGRVEDWDVEEVKEEIRNRLANESVFKERENYLATLRKTAQIDEKL